MTRLLILQALCLLTSAAWAQTLPNVSLKDIEGNAIQTADLVQEEGPTVFCFWATWCSRAGAQQYAELYEDWVDETGVKVVCEHRRHALHEPRGAVRQQRGMGVRHPVGPQPRLPGVNVSNVPHTFVVDTEGNVIRSHNNYADGDEYELYQDSSISE